MNKRTRLFSLLLLFFLIPSSIHSMWEDQVVEYTVGQVSKTALKIALGFVGYVFVNGLVNYATHKVTNSLVGLEGLSSEGKINLEVTFPKEQKAFLTQESEIWRWVKAIKQTKTKRDNWLDLLTYKDLKPGLNLYNYFGYKPAKGVILSGPPGVGKSYMAEEAARKLKVPLVKIDGSSFTTQVFAGSGVAELKLFFTEIRQLVKKYGSIVVFIDEFDALKGRGNTSQGFDDAAVNTLNRMLDDMPEGVHIVCATNRVEIIDKAIKRPGRLSVIEVGYPQFEERRDGLLLLTKKMPLYASSHEYLSILANRAEYLTYAELFDVANKAAREALEEARKTNFYCRALTVNHFNKAFSSVLASKVKELNETCKAKGSSDKGKEKCKDEGEASFGFPEKDLSEQRFITDDLLKYYNGLLGDLNTSQAYDVDYTEKIIHEYKQNRLSWIRRFYAKWNGSPYVKYSTYGVGIGLAYYYRNIYVPHITHFASKIWKASFWDKTAVRVPSFLITDLGLPLQ